MENALDLFHPIIRSWFKKAFGEPSPPQKLGWPSIASGNHTLIVAPTGSGKTIAAFLWCINQLLEENMAGDRSTGVRVLYISPLKALNNDIHRNLETPLGGIRDEALLAGVTLPKLRSAVRTGDTTQAERTKILKNPPDILITTPESFYLILSSKHQRKILSGVQYVIIDEIHSLSGNKRGVHLSLSLERLEAIVPVSCVRIGLSATQKPLQETAQFLGGLRWDSGKLIPRPVAIIDAGQRKSMDLQVVCPVRDFTDMPMSSAWDSIFPQLIHAIAAHSTTLIFVNNRRLAERIAAKLNELLGGSQHTLNNYAVPVAPPGYTPSSSRPEFVVQAYHGSMSRTARERMEADLKDGRLKVLVATSALELGIDIGSIDLVIQIESPKGIARGLQRVGRSGHLVRASSKGRIFATHPNDLIESTVVAKAMVDHDIESTHIPVDCLDVLAQQLISCVAVEDWNVVELYRLIRQSYCYYALSQKMFLHVVQMVAGRYTHEAFRELRARVSWDKSRNILSALPGSTHIAVTNAGTIPDRGYYAVYLEDQKTRIGEVDEEFIYESRVGDTFILGTSAWRIVAIDPNRVIVSPAPGQPARMPFWKGEGLGRTFELGNKIGEFLGEMSARIQSGSKAECFSWLRTGFPIDEHSAWNLIDYVRQQISSTKSVPTHESLVVEGFRDEIGDPRLVIHTCFGRGVNGLLAMALSQQLKESFTVDIQVLYNDSGILFRCSDVERLPLDIFQGFSISEAERSVLDELPASALFGALFRQNAERALLLPKAHPKRRRPLWLQRLRASDLLQLAQKFDDFPIVIETLRDSLNDVLDFKHFKEVAAGIESGRIAIETVLTETPSPFAASLLFDFMSVYMYKGERPAASDRASMPSRDLLGEVIDLASFRSVVKKEALQRIEEQLQYTAETRKARTPQELLEIFLAAGELSDEEIAERTQDPHFKNALLHQRSIIETTIVGKKYYAAAEELPFYLELANISDRGWEVAKREDALRFLMLRILRSHGPISSEAIAQRYGITESECIAVLESLSDNAVVRGSFTVPAGETEWCYRPNLERIHRASLNILRKEIVPAKVQDFAEFLLRWQHRHPSVRAAAGTEDVLEQLEACMLQPELWEREILRERAAQYDPSVIRSLSAQGEIICTGTPAGRTMWIFRGNGNCFMNGEVHEEKLSPAAREVLRFLKENGASFLLEIRDGTRFSLPTVNKAIAELFWNALLTNDAVDEVLRIRRFKNANQLIPAERIQLTNPRHNPLRYAAMNSVRKAIRTTPGWSGRWSLTHTRRVMGSILTLEEKITRQAQLLLLRYGIVAREIAKREDNLSPWSLLALELQRMEIRGEIRRGYFLEGFSGMQFALPAAVDALRSLKPQHRDTEPLVINACDPANPYGFGIEPSGHELSAVRISRLPQNYFVLLNGSPILWIENFGTRVYTMGGAVQSQVREGLSYFVAHMRATVPERSNITLEFLDHQRPSESTFLPTLRALGFYRDRMQTMRLELR